jgi:hypothetical protein
MLNAIEPSVSQVDGFFRRQWKLLEVRYEIDRHGNYTVFHSQTNAIVQKGPIAPNSSEENRNRILENLRDGAPMVLLRGEALKRNAELLSYPNIAVSAVVVPARMRMRGH